MLFTKSKPWEYEEQFLTTLCKDCHEYASYGMKQSIHRLGEAIKKFGLHPKDIDQISKAFEESKPAHVYELTASAIAYGIKEMQLEMIAKFFKYINEKDKHLISWQPTEK